MLTDICVCSVNMTKALLIFLKEGLPVCDVFYRPWILNATLTVLTLTLFLYFKIL